MAEQRYAQVHRKTSETDISLTLTLDGNGKQDIATGIGFFDHMLSGFTRHGFFDLDLKVAGDLEVDCHHTIEDRPWKCHPGSSGRQKRNQTIWQHDTSHGRDTGSVCH